MRKKQPEKIYRFFLADRGELPDAYIQVHDIKNKLIACEFMCSKDFTLRKSFAVRDEKFEVVPLNDTQTDREYIVIDSNGDIASRPVKVHKKLTKMSKKDRLLAMIEASEAEND